MKKERLKLDLSLIELNEGQLSWLPKNPRTWTQTDIDKTAASIKQDPDFLEDRPLLVVSREDSPNLVVFAGNLRSVGARAARLSRVPCVLYSPEEDEDYETIRRRAMKDNGSFGQFDWDEVFSSPWGQMDLDSMGIGKAFAHSDEASGMHLSTEGGEGDEGYDEFVDKFKPKLTTDDCYTPPAVYDAVLEFVGTLTPMAGRKVVRPFFPGGDYEDMKQYPANCIVVDNPPFSLLTKIIRFYCEKQIQFFIFGPALTLFSAATDCDITYIIPDSVIMYENGARVHTGFITNIESDIRIWCCPELGRMIDEAQPHEDKTKQGFVYPDNIVTAAILGKISKRGIELKIRKVSCEPLKESDSALEQGRHALYGGGYILSDRAAAEHAAAERAAAERAAAERAAAERAAAEHAAAERADATRLNLSPREKAIIERLNEKELAK